MKPEHPEMVEPPGADRRAQPADRSARRRRRSSGRINGLLADYRGALSAEQALQARVAQLKGDVLNLRGRSIQYTILQREVDTNRSLYDALLQRYKQIGVAGGVGMAPVSIVDRAAGTDVPVQAEPAAQPPHRPWRSALPPASPARSASSSSTTRSRAARTSAASCRWPASGTVPKTPAKDSFVDDLKNPTSIISEAYSAIVAALRFSTEEGMPKVLLVTSTRSGEGKSSSALAIAQNFARRGKSRAADRQRSSQAGVQGRERSEWA